MVFEQFVETNFKKIAIFLGFFRFNNKYHEFLIITFLILLKIFFNPLLPGDVNVVHLIKVARMYLISIFNYTYLIMVYMRKKACLIWVNKKMH